MIGSMSRLAFAVCAAVAFTAAPSHAGRAKSPAKLVHVTEGIDYALPHGSPLKFDKLEPDFLGAAFKGRITLSGAYYYGRLDTDPQNDMIGLFFMPDAPFAKQLPYWRQDGLVKEVIFQNSDAFIKAVIPATLADAVKRGKRASVRGRVTFVAEEFETVVSCGAAIYVTRFHSLAEKPKLYAARRTEARTTC
jgi:hypothetical protein